jgi:radical SAM family RiPP maturation amino acid epimerase
MPTTIMPLLGDLSGVPPDYLRDVADTKRVLERLMMDPSFRDAFACDARAAMASLGVCLRPAQVTPLVGGDAGQGQIVARGDYPLSVLRYCAYVQEKAFYRRLARKESEPSHPRMAAWRARQINRCHAELGADRQSAIIHAPAAFELSEGCTVGCWFCGVAAAEFGRTWPYTDKTAALWRETLATVRDLIGGCAGHGFLYWATDPLDNPDYERFMADFHSIAGRCPQTTTAQAQKDPERTRQLLRLSHSLGSTIDRFSIIALSSLHRVHEAFSPAELLRVECIPQNREASPAYRKSNSGRARKFAHKRPGELNAPEESSTIACVSGFLFNMIDLSVQLVTPCAASDRWPLGYWVLDQGTFGSAAELRELLEKMIATRMRAALSPSDVVRLHPGVRLEAGQAEVRAVSRAPAAVFRGQPDPAGLAALIAGGSSTAEEIALRRLRAAGVPPAETLSLIGQLFAQGLLDEEPPVPDPGKRRVNGKAEAL